MAKQSRLWRILLGSVVAFVMGCVFVLGAWAFGLTTPDGTGFAIPREVKTIELESTMGDEFTLNDLRGSYTLVSFGYTHCPDVCPVTLTEFMRVKRELTDAQQQRVQFAFISVDGARDTPELLTRYLQRFDETFIGVSTPDDDVMQQVADGFNVFYEMREVPGTQAAYLVDHTATIFLLDRRGNVVNLYPFGTPPVEIAEDIQARL